MTTMSLLSDCTTSSFLPSLVSVCVANLQNPCPTQYKYQNRRSTHTTHLCFSFSLRLLQDLHRILSAHFSLLVLDTLENFYSSTFDHFVFAHVFSQRQKRLQYLDVSHLFLVLLLVCAQMCRGSAEGQRVDSLQPHSPPSRHTILHLVDGDLVHLSSSVSLPPCLSHHLLLSVDVLLAPHLPPFHVIHVYLWHPCHQCVDAHLAH
eukprot:GHVN01002260.1.p1 GENE.GHVN01002260.1~~GHVN01002260.1.p1  ORF type:complete len:205 (-),score=12.05 GHVN01002260.1:371-985(-)